MLPTLTMQKLKDRGQKLGDGKWKKVISYFQSRESKKHSQQVTELYIQVLFTMEINREVVDDISDLIFYLP